MNSWKHCLLSQPKFGGQPDDYLAIHSFLDSSCQPRHRLLYCGAPLEVEVDSGSNRLKPHW